MFNYGSTESRVSRTSSRIGGGVEGVTYPSPFFDLAHTFLPPTIKAMFQWCRYYYLTNPLIAAVINKMAEYPITDIVIDSDNKGLKDQWEGFFQNDVQLRSTLIEIGLFYFCYGNAIISISHPFTKWLKCKSCNHAVQAKKAKYQFRDNNYYLECKRCGTSGDADVYDQSLKTPRGTKLIMWNPEDINISYNSISGRATYYYKMPTQLLNEIAMGKRETVEQIPQIFIDSVRRKEMITLNSDNVFHLRRPSVFTNDRDRGWGSPIMLPVLKDTFYLQIMKKAQETILSERIVPLTAIFPQQGSATADPYCVSLDTLIETRNGIKPAATVLESDYLRSHTGQWRKINAIVDRVIDPDEYVYKITVGSLPDYPFTISEEHPVLAANDDLTRSWIKAKDLKVGDYVCYPVNNDRPASTSSHMDRIVNTRIRLLSMGIVSEVKIDKDVGAYLTISDDQMDYLVGTAKQNKLPDYAMIKDDYLYLKIQEIKGASDGRIVRGFDMDEDKSFCVLGVATHNTTTNLLSWRDAVSSEIQKWRIDRNYLPIFPIPLGHQVIGGDGRALLLSNEIKIWTEHIITGLGVPFELISGSLSWSGSNVSLRMLENQFLRYMSYISQFINRFLIKRMAAYLSWPVITTRFKPLKMAEDMQNKAYLFQLSQAGKISDATLLQTSDLNPEEEYELRRKEIKAQLTAIKEEQLAQAEIAGEAAVIQAKYQAKAQNTMAQEATQAQQGLQGTAPGEPGEDVGAQPVDPMTQQQQSGPMEQIVSKLRSVAPDVQQRILQQIGQTNPQLASTVSSMLGSKSAGLPLPEQRPPRRGPGSAII